MKVFVVAWHYDGGAGFDWYYTAKDADEAFEEEKENVLTFSADKWEAYRFDFLSECVAPDTVTREIDSNLDDLCSGDDVRAVNYVHTHPRCSYVDNWPSVL